MSRHVHFGYNRDVSGLGKGDNFFDVFLRVKSAIGGCFTVFSGFKLPPFSVSLHPTCSTVHASILGDDVTYKIAVPGKHIVMNSLAVLAASSLAGADLALSALALAQIKPAAGRGVREVLSVAGGTVTLIDESYNANPASTAASLTVLGQAKVGSRVQIRRHAQMTVKIWSGETRG